MATPTNFHKTNAGTDDIHAWEYSDGKENFKVYVDDEGGNYNYRIYTTHGSLRDWGKADNKRVARAIAVLQMRRYNEGHAGNMGNVPDKDTWPSALRSADSSSYEIAYAETADLSTERDENSVSGWERKHKNDTETIWKNSETGERVEVTRASYRKGEEDWVNAWRFYSSRRGLVSEYETREKARIAAENHMEDNM